MDQDDPFAALIAADDYHSVIDLIDVPDEVRAYLHSIKRNRGGRKRDPHTATRLSHEARAWLHYHQLRGEGISAADAKLETRLAFEIEEERMEIIARQGDPRVTREAEKQK